MRIPVRRSGGTGLCSPLGSSALIPCHSDHTSELSRKCSHNQICLVPGLVCRLLTTLPGFPCRREVGGRGSVTSSWSPETLEEENNCPSTLHGGGCLAETPYSLGHLINGQMASVNLKVLRFGHCPSRLSLQRAACLFSLQAKCYPPATPRWALSVPPGA